VSAFDVAYADNTPGTMTPRTIESITQKVSTLLLKYPSLKDGNYNELIFAYWQEYDEVWNDMIIVNIKNLTQCDSIQRAKRKLVEHDPLTFGGIDLQKASYRLDKEGKMIDYARHY